jgi:hypothetical protein
LAYYSRIEFFGWIVSRFQSITFATDRGFEERIKLLKKFLLK